MGDMNNFVHVDINRTASSSVRKALGLQDTPMHVPARQKRGQNTDAWQEALTFTFVRNPFMRVASQYHHRRALEGCPPFTEWLVDRYVLKNRQCEHTGDYPYFDRLWWPQHRWVTDRNGAVIVDFIGRFERLNTDWVKLCERLGRNVHLPHVGKLAHDPGPYTDLYTDRAKEIVADVFDKDLDLFGYTFPQPTLRHEDTA